MSLAVCQVPGPPRDAGYAHGVMLRDVLASGFREPYADTLAAINRCDRGDMHAQAERWFAGLPEHFQEEIDGMAAGALVPRELTAEFLYADIARATRVGADDAMSPIRDEGDGGPMCSATIVGVERTPWVARNCDWLSATLTRGTACVVHAVPHRIPVMAVGIRGDIDVDTGMNAERVWLHLHTLLSTDDPPMDRTCISWLFWAREALETCATLDEIERFIESTGRDRGVIAVAIDGKSGEGAVFECAKSAHRRFDFDPSRPIVATNHAIDKPISPERASKSRPGSTVARACALRDLVEDHPPEYGPDDLSDLLADEAVERRTPKDLRTIYSAVCRPADESVWFASGSPEGQPAASTGRWERVRWSW